MAEVDPPAVAGRGEVVAPELVAELEAARSALRGAAVELTVTVRDAMQHGHLAALVLERRRAGELSETLHIVVARVCAASQAVAEGGRR